MGLFTSYGLCLYLLTFPDPVMSVPWSEDPAVETAEEAKEPAEADINELCKDMFSKMATYLTGELTGKALQCWLASKFMFLFIFS